VLIAVEENVRDLALTAMLSSHCQSTFEFKQSEVRDNLRIEFQAILSLER